MLSYEEALAKILATVTPLTPVGMSLDEAGGLVLAEAVTARWDMPRADNSAMDGFAVSSGKATGLLPIVGAAYAGHPFSGTVAAGNAVRITTGAPIPDGCDAVVPAEDTEEFAGGVTLGIVPQPFDHVRCQGEEYRRGERLLEQGTVLRAGEIGLLASTGASRVKVHPKPRVAIISTGDELVELGQEPGPGQIVNSNLHQLAARIRECGGEVLRLGVGRDEPGGIDALIDAGRQADLLISTGGVSVGERDFVREAFDRHGFTQLFWKVAIKPGKPVLFGTLDGKPCYGLPGNPAAAAATFELFVRPALRRLAGHAQFLPETRKGILVESVRGGGKRQSFLWCRLDWIGDGYRVQVTSRQGSGQNRSLQGANALLAVPVDVETLAAGDVVAVQLLRSPT
jgi:molybdopterin molybdotransferase